jgi:glycerophosphoryl diester phosphodiesterase
MFLSKKALRPLELFLILLAAWVVAEIGCVAKKEIVRPPWKGKYPVLVIAHRGFSGQAPENTLIAFKNAMDLGCDMIELDIHLSKDREVVVMHDDTLNRTTTGQGRIADFTLNELKKLDAGSWLGAQFSDERIPTLKEVLKLSKDKIPVNIEIKHSKEGKYPIEELAEKALKEVKEVGMINQVNFFSFNSIALKRIRDKEPKAWVTLLYHEAWKFPRDITKGEDYPILGLRDKHLTKEGIAQSHQQGLQVYVWTVDAPEEMEKFINWGVDGIITNHPDRLIKILKARYP